MVSGQPEHFDEVALSQGLARGPCPKAGTTE